jgi:hypothetical protein
MKTGDLIILKEIYINGCGRDYPANSIGTLASVVPDSDGDLRVVFAIHSNGNYTYVPADKVKLIPEDSITKAKDICENAVL